MTSKVNEVPSAIERFERVDAIAKPLGRLAGRIDGRERLASVLLGVPWLGHPLHPVLTDFPIGFWSGAVVLDLLGGERTEAAADTLVGLGIASALPTAAAGLAEYNRVTKPTTRIATVHAVANTVALACMTGSFAARRSGHRGTGRAFALLGTGALMLGGYLGGHLTYAEGVGVEEPGSEGRSNEPQRGEVSTPPAEVGQR
jgi:uncharacterized membrane protein